MVGDWTPEHALATAPAPLGPALGHLAASQRGLNRGLFTRERRVILRLDEVIIPETPPLYSCYCRVGQQACGPISGNRAKRILHGALNLQSGEVLLLLTEVWDEATHQYCLPMLRAHGRGWPLIVCEDRGSPHTAEDSRELAAALGIEIHLWPRATPELNAMDPLRRPVKGRALADRPTRSSEQSADAACRYLLEMSPRERLQKAGIFSGTFWLSR